MIVIVIVYTLKSKVTVWRATRCLRLCDRLSNPLLVMFPQLIIRRGETSDGCCYSLLLKVKRDRAESCEMSDAL